MFYQIFLSPQVKRSAVITYKNGLFELPHQLLKDLRFKRLGGLETNPLLSWVDVEYFHFHLFHH